MHANCQKSEATLSGLQPKGLAVSKLGLEPTCGGPGQAEWGLI